MKVLVTTDRTLPSWTFVTELARGLEREGVAVLVAATNGPLEDEQRALLRTLRNVEFAESSYRPEWPPAGDDREVRAAAEWLLELAHRHDVDVVHLDDLLHGAQPWPVSPVVTALRLPPDGLAARRHAAAAIEHAAALVTDTHAAASTIQQQCGVRARAAIPIPRGRAQPLHPARSKEPMILAAGEYADASGNIAAVARVATRISWPIFVIGHAPSYAVTMTSLTNTHFLGAISARDCAAVLARAGVFTQPRSAQADACTVLDAASCGCALVLGDVPELRERWDGAAAFVDPDEEDSLRSTLIWLMSDPQARADLGARALHRAAGFTAERMASAYLSLYIDVTLGASIAVRDRCRSLGALDRSA